MRPVAVTAAVASLVVAVAIGGWALADGAPTWRLLLFMALGFGGFALLGESCDRDRPDIVIEKERGA